MASGRPARFGGLETQPSLILGQGFVFPLGFSGSGNWPAPRQSHPPEDHHSYKGPCVRLRVSLVCSHPGTALSPNSKPPNYQLPIPWPYPEPSAWPGRQTQKLWQGSIPKTPRRGGGNTQEGGTSRWGFSAGKGATTEGPEERDSTEGKACLGRGNLTHKVQE